MYTWFWPRNHCPPFHPLTRSSWGRNEGRRRLPISKVFSNFQNAVHRRSVHPVDGKQRFEQGPVTYDDDKQVTDDKRTSCNLQSPLHQ